VISIQNKKNTILNAYRSLVDFLADFLGNSYEIVLHDLSNVEASIIAIRNGHISGREIGGPLTDLGLKILREKTYLEKDYLANYLGKAGNNKILRSATYFIKNNKGEIIGMLCINQDLTNILGVKRYFDEMVESVFPKQPNVQELNYPEHFSVSLKDLLHTILNEIFASTTLTPERMTLEEKISIVQKLNARGVFLLKGAVTEVAKLLGTSEATIYRYLKNNKKSLV